jgi:hypothetical protein
MNRIACNVTKPVPVALALAISFAGEDVHATTFGLCGCTPQVSTANGHYQHPEIAYTFWEGRRDRVWTNGTNRPTRSQHIGFLLSLVNNGQYWAGIAEPGFIAAPRLAPYATIYTGSVNGHDPADGTYSTDDIVRLINIQISDGHLPYPQANDNSIYAVIVPAGSRASDCSGAYDYNFPAEYSDGTPYWAVYGEDYAGLSHEFVESIASYEGVNVTNNCGGNQIADPCGCRGFRQDVNGFEVASYLSGTTGYRTCVVPDQWGGLWEWENGTGWFRTSGSFPMRQANGGSRGVVATDAKENGSKGNSVHFYDGSTWSTIGDGGSQFAAGGGIVAGVALDPAYGVFYYTLSDHTWSAAAGPSDQPVTGVTVTSNGVIVATDPFANPWYFEPSNPGWHQIAGPGDQFVASGRSVFALNPWHNDIFYWDGPGTGFSFLQAESTTQIVAAADARAYATTRPGQAGLWAANRGRYLGYTTQLAVTGLSFPWVYVDPRTDNVGAVDERGYTFALMGGRSGLVISSGAGVYVAGCDSGVAPCVTIF